MRNCPESDKIKNAVIPDLNCNNPAPESILRLPTMLPGVISPSTLEETYQLASDDVTTAWKATYYQINPDGVSTDTNTTICVDNTATNYDKFTWVDWLTPAQQLEQNRNWIKQPECSTDGGTNGLIHGPVRPPASRQPIIALPMPSVTITNKYSGGGGGGGGGSGGGSDISISGYEPIEVYVSGGTDYTIDIDLQRLYELLFSNDGNVHFSWNNGAVVGWFNGLNITSPYETILISVPTGDSMYDMQFELDVDWTCVQIDESLAQFVEAEYSDTGVLLKMKPLPELGDGILMMKDGQLQVYPVPANMILGGDENGQLIGIPYAECDSACEDEPAEESSSSSSETV